jgi:hypothetical protein
MSARCAVKYVILMVPLRARSFPSAGFGCPPKYYRNLLGAAALCTRNVDDPRLLVLSASVKG